MKSAFASVNNGMGNVGGGRETGFIQGNNGDMYSDGNTAKWLRAGSATYKLGWNYRYPDDPSLYGNGTFAFHSHVQVFSGHGSLKTFSNMASPADMRVASSPVFGGMPFVIGSPDQLFYVNSSSTKLPDGSSFGNILGGAKWWEIKCD